MGRGPAHRKRPPGGHVLWERFERPAPVQRRILLDGPPYSTVVKGGSAKLAEIQKLLFEGHGIEAHHLFGRYLLGYPVEQQKYQSLGNLVLDFEDKSPATEYRRDLDLDTGITKITYTRDGVHYVHEAFVSHPDQAIVFRIAADRPGVISFEGQLRGVRNQAHSKYATDYFQMDLLGDDGLHRNGKGADYLGIEGKIRYRARLKARVRGGRVRTGIKYAGPLRVTRAGRPMAVRKNTDGTWSFATEVGGV